MNFQTFDSKFHEIFGKYQTRISESEPSLGRKLAYSVFSNNKSKVLSIRLRILVTELNGKHYINVYFRSYENRTMYMQTIIDGMPLQQFSFSLIASYISSIKREK